MTVIDVLHLLTSNFRCLVWELFCVHHCNALTVFASLLLLPASCPRRALQHRALYLNLGPACASADLADHHHLLCPHDCQHQNIYLEQLIDIMFNIDIGIQDISGILSKFSSPLPSEVPRSAASISNDAWTATSTSPPSSSQLPLFKSSLSLFSSTSSSSS